ncbi:MAG TPA: glycogen debranching N-terminal domain-containing protein [Micromonosporaceae bacterium]|nr:glycogen debranching N-terminal domain-containing protein [Micromonosporaceae bacterium]
MTGGNVHDGAASSSDAAPSASGASALNTGEPAVAVQAAQADLVTVVEGSTFCLSSRDGDVRPGGVHGLFVRDARVLSRWELRLDSHEPQALSVRADEAFTARFTLRRPPLPGLADSTMLVLRERLVGDGLRETVTLENLGRRACAVTMTLYADADFADLFAVKDGRGAGAGAVMTVERGDLDELVLTSRDDPGRALRISGSDRPLVTPGALSWRVDVPPRSRWSAEVVAEPVVSGRRLRPRFGRGERVESTAAARKLSAWRAASATLTADDPLLTAVLARTGTDLGALRIDAGGGQPFVAAGAPWFMTLFGRDSLLTAWMTLPLDVELAVGTLQTLAGLQGRRVDPVTEEQPGRILHELRLGPDRDRALGGGGHYYGTVDATPLFVMLLAECWRWGADEAVVRGLLPAADAAMTWLTEYGAADGDGFVKYRRSSDRGLVNQGWKDSFDGVSHLDGRAAQPPIALCEVQGYAYAAMLARAELAELLERDDARAAAWRGRAERLRTLFHERFWLPQGWYALALDGGERPVEPLSSNTAHCLWTGLATDECAAELIGHLASDRMDSGYGLRTLATDAGAYNPMSYHNGSVWPHDTAIAVAGLLRYGHLPGAVPLAHRLAAGVLDAAAAFGDRPPELYCGFPRDRFSPPVPYPTSCSPQAWASAAPLLLVRAALGLAPHVPRRALTLRPRLPGSWGGVALSDLRLGPATVTLTAHVDHATVDGLPDDWTYIPHQRTASKP